MNKTVSNVLKNVLTVSAKAGIGYAAKEAGKRYPILTKIGLVQEPQPKRKDPLTIAKNLPGFFAGKYSEAKVSKKEAEKQRKKDQMKSYRNTIIAGVAGLTCGAAATYVYCKNNQIKQSDYVFDDNAPAQSQEIETNNQNQLASPEPTFQRKDFKDFGNNYQISTDGTTLIRRNISRA